MQYIVDAVIVLMLLLSVYRGYKRGFVKTVFSCLSVVCAIVCASLFGTCVGEVIRTAPFYEAMSDGVEEKIEKYLDEMLEEGLLQTADIEKELSQLPVGKSLEYIGIDDTWYDSLKISLESGADNVKEALAKEVCGKVMLFLSDAAGILAVFFASLVILKIVCAAIDGVVKLPLLNSINKAAGVAAGLVLGIISVFVLCTILGIAAPYIPENPVVYPGMENDTLLYGMFLNINPLILLLFA